MTKSLFRTLAAFATLALAATAALPAAAATLTYSDPNCAGFQITGSGGSFTLTCAKIQCSITGNTTPLTTVDPTLTAACSPTPSGYVWRLLTGPFSHPTCNAPVQQADPKQAVLPKPTGIVAGETRACLYQVDATAAPLAGQSMVTVTWSDAPPAAPTCTPLTTTTNPSPLTPAGGTVTVDSHCSAVAPITYTWQRTAAPPGAGTFTASTGVSQNDNLAANATASAQTYTYQVTACTSPTTCASAQSVSVLVPGTGGGGGPISCPGFPATQTIDLPWSNQTIYSKDVGSGFAAGGAMVIRFTVPAGAPASANPGTLDIAQYIDGNAYRWATLSTTACDFSSGVLYSPTVPRQYYPQYTVSMYSRVTTPGTTAYVQLFPGTTYYVNVKNAKPDGSPDSCGFATCNVILNWTIPN